MAHDTMLSPYFFEPEPTPDERKMSKAASAHNSKVAKAIETAKGRFSSYIHAGGPDEVKERLAYVAPDLIATVKEVVAPTPGVLRAVRAALKTAEEWPVADGEPYFAGGSDWVEGFDYTGDPTWRREYATGDSVTIAGSDGEFYLTNSENGSVKYFATLERAQSYADDRFGTRVASTKTADWTQTPMGWYQGDDGILGADGYAIVYAPAADVYTLLKDWDQEVGEFATLEEAKAAAESANPFVASVKTAGDNPFAKKDDDEEDDQDQSDGGDDQVDPNAQDAAQAVLDWQTATDEEGEYLVAQTDDGTALAIYPYENAFYWQTFDPNDESGAVLAEGTADSPEAAQVDAEGAANGDGEEESPFDQDGDGTDEDDDDGSDDENPFAKKADFDDEINPLGDGKWEAISAAGEIREFDSEVDAQSWLDQEHELYPPVEPYNTEYDSDWERHLGNAEDIAILNTSPWHSHDDVDSGADEENPGSYFPWAKNAGVKVSTNLSEMTDTELTKLYQDTWNGADDQDDWFDYDGEQYASNLDGILEEMEKRGLL